MTTTPKSSSSLAATRRQKAAERRARRDETHAQLLLAQEAVNDIPLRLGDMPADVVTLVHEAVVAVRAAQSAVKKEVKG